MEFMRFMRYVLPGLVVIAEYLLCLFLLSSFDVDFRGIIEKSFVAEWVRNKDSGQLAGLAVSAFLMSGGIGYLLSAFYHMIWNMAGGYFYHYPVVFRLVDAGHVSIRNVSLKQGDVPAPLSIDQVAKLSRRHIWEIFYVLWYRATKFDEGLKSNMEIIARQIDVMHGVGAIGVGSILAAILWVSMLFELGTNTLCVGFLNGVLPLLWGFLILVHLVSYLVLRRTVTNNLNNSLMTSLSRDRYRVVEIKFFGD